MKDYYKILEIERSATDEDIKKSFRKLSLIHHPDKGGNEDKFKEINEAYMTLSNPQKRQEYDNPISGGTIFDFMFRNNENIDISKLNIDGDDMQIKFNISFSYIILGGTFKIPFKYNDYCDNCKGSGFLTSEICNDCNGSGFTVKRQSNGFMHFESRSQCNTCKGTGKKGIDKCTVCDSKGTVIIEKELVLDIQKNYNKMVPFILKEQGMKGRNRGKNGDIIIFLNPIFPRYEDLKDEDIKCFEKFKNEKSSS